MRDILYPTLVYGALITLWITPKFSIIIIQVKEKTDNSIGTQLRETKLEQRVAKFISLICNISMMKQQMMEIGLLASYLFTKLSKYVTDIWLGC